MMENTTLDVEALEARAKLQVKVHRTLLRHQLIMWGNALLVAYLFAVLLPATWFMALSLGGRQLISEWSAPLIGVPAERMLWLSAVMYGGLKVAAFLLLLCPGLGLRITGSAMKP